MDARGTWRGGNHGKTRRAVLSAAESLENRVMLSAWYVATNGNDGGSGSLANPFRTIQQAANLAMPGDTVYIRGGVYRETVTSAHSGLPGKPITYEPYNNESVTIDGANLVSGWSGYRNSIYSAPQTPDLGEGNNEIFVDGAMVSEARWPNQGADASRPTWFTASSVKVNVAATGLSTVTIYQPWLTQPAGAWVGATLHIAAGQEWVDQTAKVIASGNGYVTATYQQETTYQVPRVGNRFYLSGAFVALDSPGEWYRDPQSGRLYLRTPGSDNPVKHTVEAKARLYGFELGSLANITIHNIHLFGCTIDTNSESHGILLDHLDAEYVSQSIGITADTLDPWNAQYHPHTSGIILNGTGNILQYSTIAWSSGDGVFLGGSGNTVQDCVIHDVDYEAGDEAAVTMLGSNEKVLYNTIYNAGRSGIVARFTTDSQILHNVIHDVGLQTTDLGAIYTWGTDGQGTEIGHNICYNIRTGGYGGVGVYLDNGSSNYIVDHNVVWNADAGLKVNPPATYNLILNNTVQDVTWGVESSGSQDMTGTRYVNNIVGGQIMAGSGAEWDNNLISDGAGLFVNAGSHNYQLRHGSAAINAGQAASPYTSGYAGAAPDLGAYEYGAPAFAAGAPAGSGALSGSGSPSGDPANVPSGNPPAVAPPSSTSNPPTARNPRAAFNPRSYDHAYGLTPSASGIRFGVLWSWSYYKQVDFGSGVTRLISQFSNLGSATQYVQLRIDSPTGPAIGTLTLPPAGPRSAQSTITAAIMANLRGVHDLFFVLIDFHGGAELDGFRFV